MVLSRWGSLGAQTLHPIQGAQGQRGGLQRREKQQPHISHTRGITQRYSAGIHYVGQLHDGSLWRFLVDQLTDGQLEWAPMPPTFDAVVLGEPGRDKAVRLCTGTRGYFDKLKEQFPGEEAAIDEFKRLVKVMGWWGCARGAWLCSWLTCSFPGGREIPALCQPRGQLFGSGAVQPCCTRMRCTRSS